MTPTFMLLVHFSMLIAGGTVLWFVTWAIGQCVRRTVRSELAAIRTEEAAAQKAHLDADMAAMKERAK